MSRRPLLSEAEEPPHRAWNRKSYAKHKARHIASVKAWREANMDKVQSYHERYWAKHGERVRRERNEKRAAAYLEDPKGTWLVEVFRAAKVRAKNRGIPFDVATPQLELPDTCPVLGIPLVYHAQRRVHGQDSPSLDRIVPEIGYVAGNLRVISNRANTLKNNATLYEMRLVVADMARLAGSRS